MISIKWTSLLQYNFLDVTKFCNKKLYQHLFEAHSLDKRYLNCGDISYLRDESSQIYLRHANIIGEDRRIIP